jgi:hypothetical protein
MARAFCGCGAEFAGAGTGCSSCVPGEPSDHFLGKVGHRFEDHSQFVGAEFGSAGGAGTALQPLDDLSAALFGLFVDIRIRVGLRLASGRVIGRAGWCPVRC